MAMIEITKKDYDDIEAKMQKCIDNLQENLACALQQEKPQQQEARARQLEQPPLCATREKPRQQGRPCAANKYIKLFKKIEGK